MTLCSIPSKLVLLLINIKLFTTVFIMGYLHLEFARILP